MIDLTFLLNYFQTIDQFFDLDLSFFPLLLIVPFGLALFFVCFKIIRGLI